GLLFFTPVCASAVTATATISAITTKNLAIAPPSGTQPSPRRPVLCARRTKDSYFCAEPLRSALGCFRKIDSPLRSLAPFSTPSFRNAPHRKGFRQEQTLPHFAERFGEPICKSPFQSLYFNYVKKGGGKQTPF